MKFPSFSLGVMLLLSALAAHATDDMLIYSDRFNNGWGDDWSWMPHYPTNNPVSTGFSNSMACVPSGTWQAWWLKSDTSLETAIYTNVSFWLNGGTNGGQSILVSGETNGTGLPGIWVTVPSNQWQQVTLSLAELGINNVTNLTGFQIGNGTSTQPFFIDDLRLVAAPAPAVVHVSVLANQTVRTVSGNVFGINQVAWDGNVSAPASVAVLNAMGDPCLRWPGGSWGDGYHWTNEAWSYGNTSARNWGSFSPDFIQLATNTHAQAFIIVNYGTSDADEAAYGVRMFNVTNHCNFKYWEVGNEVGGSWEVDNNTNPPWQPHDPWTYAMRFSNYYAQMKAVDSTIKIGAVADTTEDGTSNYTNHPVVNPRTGVTHNGWTPVMLTYMRSNNCLPDFLIEHNYGPTAGDTQDLLYSKQWATDAASLRQMLTDYLGSAGTNVTLEATENGTGGDKQCVSVTGGLFYADTIGQILQTEFNSRLWWDFRNGASDLTDPDPAFYGWRTNSDGSFLVDGGIVYGLGGVGSAYPTYYVAKLMPHFAAGGDTVVYATSDYPLLSVYAVKRTNGTLTLLVINKSSSSNLTAAINLSGYLPYTNAIVYSYGIPQDTAAETGLGSPDIAQTSLTGVLNDFSVTFAPFSASVMVLSAADEPPFTPTGLTASFSNAAVSLTWNAADGAASYTIGRSIITGGPYTNIATGVTATTYLDTGLINGTTYYYVVAATNAYGISSNSAEASATPLIEFTGTVIGTPGSWDNLGNTITNVFDGNTNTYYDATVGTGDWAGLDLGSGAAAIVTQIEYCPRATFASRMVGGQFQGANVANFSSGVVTLFTVSSTPPDGVMTVQTVTNAASFRYLRYIGPANGYCNVAEVEFWGISAISPPSAPTGLSAAPGGAQVALSWNASSGATNYLVQRSTTSGSGYINIATNASLAFTNTGLSNGTLYYFVVSGVNWAGEGANSTEVSARPTSLAPTQLGFVTAGNQLQLNWPVDHTGWQLQSQTNSLGTNWVNVAGSTQTNLVTMFLNTTNGAVFFRLVWP
ncbi:MAG: fibronectin type III domain-containing protein [Limisphaerales bacterium]